MGIFFDPHQMKRLKKRKSSDFIDKIEELARERELLHPRDLRKKYRDLMEK